MARRRHASTNTPTPLNPDKVVGRIIYGIDFGGQNTYTVVNGGYVVWDAKREMWSNRSGDKEDLPHIADLKVYETVTLGSKPKTNIVAFGDPETIPECGRYLKLSIVKKL